MWYVALAFMLILLVPLGWFVYLMSRSAKLKFYLLGLTWRSFEDCTGQGFSPNLLRAFLSAYHKKGIIEVKLDEHVYTCENCKMMILAMVRLATLDPTVDNGEIEIIEFKEEDVPYDYFEATMFRFETVSVFKYRITKGPHRRRWWHITSGFKLPSFGKMKPAAQF